jgi:hypothetical protein
MAPTIAFAAQISPIAGPIIPTPSTRIACPLTEVRVEITTPLPSGWWNTPQIRRLQSTRIDPVGGKPTLVCNYGEAAALVMRLPPPGMVCHSVLDGFICAPR